MNIMLRHKCLDVNVRVFGVRACTATSAKHFAPLDPDVFLPSEPVHNALMGRIVLLSLGVALCAAQAASQLPEDARHDEKVAYDACLRVNDRAFCDADRKRTRDEARASEAARVAQAQKRQVEQLALQARADDAKAAQDYLNVFVARRQARLLASAELCIARQEKATALATLREERKVGRVGGVVDKRVLYDASQEVVAADRQIKGITAQMRRKAPMSCDGEVGGMVRQLQCVIGTERCNEHLRESSALALRWLDGTADLEALEVTLRARVSAAVMEESEAFERGIAAAFAQK
jgi:hypothetical protein